jgi:hypothetical protein
MVEMKVPVTMMMVMMIPIKSSAMVMMMATISSLREGISLAELESFSLSVFSAPQRRRCLSLIPPST